MTTNNREIVYWDCSYHEQLTYEDQDEAIEAYLDDLDDVKNLPETIEVNGYARMVFNPAHCHALTHVLEHMDEEYGDPDGGYTEPTEAMKAAEKVFLEAVAKEYTPWACEVVKTIKVNVKEWIAKNRPDWLEEEAR